MDRVILSNDNCFFEYDPVAKKIYGRDLTDFCESTAISINKRYVKRSWEALEKIWTENTTFRDAVKVVRENGTTLHQYCGQD